MTSWQPIDTAPKDVPMDTYGVFKSRTGKPDKMIRYCDDIFWSSTVRPLTRTYYDHDGDTGDYTRTHWMPLPERPVPTIKQES